MIVVGCSSRFHLQDVGLNLEGDKFTFIFLVKII